MRRDYLEIECGRLKQLQIWTAWFDLEESNKMEGKRLRPIETMQVGDNDPEKYRFEYKIRRMRNESIRDT